MARLALCSDLHIEFGSYTPPPLDADLVLLAGDVDTKGRCGRWGDAVATFGAPVVAVLGNHEHYGDKIERSLDRMRPRAAAQGLTLLENEAVVVAGVRVLGCTLWTDFCLFAGGDLAQVKRDAGLCVGNRYRGGINDFRYIRVARDNYRRFRPVDAARLHVASVEWLRARLAEPFAGPTVVLTHHAPSIRSLPPAWRSDRTACAYASHLDTLIEEMQPTLWVHGHIHASADYTIGATRVLCNPRGYMPNDLNPDFNPRLVVEV